MRISFTILGVVICFFLCTACHQEESEKKSSVTTSTTVTQPAQQPQQLTPIVSAEEKAKNEQWGNELKAAIDSGEADKEIPYRK